MDKEMQNADIGKSVCVSFYQHFNIHVPAYINMCMSVALTRTAVNADSSARRGLSA